MSKYDYSEVEQQINNVLAHQEKELNEIDKLNTSGLDSRISESEALLRSLGYGDKIRILQKQSRNVPVNFPRKVMVVPSWENLCKEAEAHVGNGHYLEELFTPEELLNNEWAVKQLNYEYNQLHHLDKYDIAICAAAGLLGAAVDILLVGIPQKTPEGLKGGTLANFIRDQFDKKFPEEEMEKLANSKVSKVPYDAQDNRNTKIYVDGLSAYYHRLMSLGHDPLLGLIFGVSDILTGRMTTIDRTGKIVSQVMENYADRKESDIFAAIAKQIIHYKSDITTSMGLPAPMMALFNLMQFGKIGEEENYV
ncbi:hypothetical protein [Rummeliibacillus suwonensis]|uniref:hypothetical protein n=1 Tax=Rummeliibacillus suwonensis TaxID=1306154 RepID=UPI002896BA69|nr:hypothetical protein [Rummeliibacillus suwonensis]